MKIITISSAICAILLSGCGDGAKRMDEAAFSRSFHVNEGYQAVFARTSQTFTSCMASNVNSNLYPDLGYGELTFVSPVLGDQIRVRFLKAASGTDVEIKMSHIGGKNFLSRKIEKWARGERSCTA